jgi:putative transcriptional regulator
MRKTKSPILEAVRETATGLQKAGVMDRVTIRDFDRMCLPPVTPLEPEQIKRIREASNVSQAVFAAVLNTSVSTVQKWEIGQKRPAGTALKLLHLVQKQGLDSMIRSHPSPRSHLTTAIAPLTPGLLRRSRIILLSLTVVRLLRPLGLR